MCVVVVVVDAVVVVVVVVVVIVVVASPPVWFLFFLFFFPFWLYILLPVGVSSGNWCALTNLAAGHPCPLDLAHAAPAIIFVLPVATRAGERASERDRERAQERDSLRQEASRALCNYCAGTLSEQSWFDIIKKNYIQLHPLTGPLPAASNNNLRSCLTLAPPAPPSETCPLITNDTGPCCC